MVTAAQTEQKRFTDAVGQAFLTSVPVEVQTKFAGKQYKGTVHEGVAEHLGEVFQAMYEHGRAAGLAEAKAGTRAAVRQQRATVALNTPAPDMGAPLRSGSRVPTFEDMDRLPVEKRMELLEKDPLLYDKIAAAASRR